MFVGGSMLNVVMIGAGKGGCALLPILLNNNNIKLLGISDIDSKAPGLEMARKLKIPTPPYYKDLITLDHIDVIIDVTGNALAAQEIHRIKKPQVEVLGGVTAKVVWGIIDEWHQKAAVLQETEAYLLNVVEYAHDMIITTDLNDKIVSFNRGAETILGYHRKEVLGKPMHYLYIDKTDDKRLRTLVKKSGSVSNYETRLKRKDGTIINIILTLSLLKERNAKVIGTVGISKDITDMRRAEEEVRIKNTELEELNRGLEQRIRERTLELERMNEDLQRADKLKTEFLSSMSHELKTPLNSIMALCGVLLERMDGDLSSEQEKQIQIIDKSGHHLHQLIMDLLDLSKIEAGHLEFKFQEFNMEDALRSSITTIKPLLTDNESILNLELNNDQLKIVSDKSKVEQVALNLLSNALKFTPKGESIVVGADLSPDRKYVSIYVKDYGAGIPKEKQHSIFERFRQVDETVKRKHGGTGLGLSITKGLVESLGGRIWVESELGKGAKFIFTLPLKPNFADQGNGYSLVHQEPKELSDIDPLKRSILVVEEDESVLYSLARFFKEEGCEVITAQNGYEALQKARRFNPHAIMLDVMLPGMDGWQVLQELKDDSRTEHIPVIIISSLDNKELGFSLGAVDYLVKPVDRYRLMRRIHNLIGDVSSKNILVIDHDPNQRALLNNVLKAYSYNVWATSDGHDAMRLLKSCNPDLVIVDFMLGNDLCWSILGEINRNGKMSRIPVLMVTQKDLTQAERERLTGGIKSVFLGQPKKQSELFTEISTDLDRRKIVRSKVGKRR
jgi:PAS domain S-box-containing protein